MALLVHLPLTGDLHNQGLANIEVTNNGATVDNNGKIGKCYSFDGSDDYISLDSSALYSAIKGDSTPFSIAMWIYNTDSGRAILFGDYGLTGAIGFNVELTASQQLRLYWSGNDSVASTAIVPLNSWTHIALVYDGKTINFYVNGVLLYNRAIILGTKNKTAGSYYLGRDSRVGGTAFNGKINDVRIYDHALSQKEISELKKALILHYSLDGNNGTLANENLILNGAEANQSPASVNESTFTDYFYHSDYATELMSNNTTDEFTMSYDYEVYGAEPSSSNAVELYAQCNNTIISKSYIKISSTNEKGHMSFTFKLTSTQAQSTLSPFRTRMRLRFAIDGAYIIIKKVKLENGNKATPWCPNPSDALYTALGYDDGIEYDTSGYGNNGTKVGALSYSIDSPRYLASTVFDGDTACIRTPYNAVAWQTNFTINLWFKKNELNSNKGYETLFGGPSGFEMDTRDGNSTTLSLYMASTRGGTVYSPFNLGEWYMVTMVNDGTNELYYVNGELSETIEKKNMPSGNYFIGAWASETRQNYKGLISDFRIYATALSAEEIQKLYTVSASIDSNGNAYSAAYVEG